MALPNDNKASVRIVHDRIIRAQHAYAQKLRDAVQSLEPLLEKHDSDAQEVARMAESELSHVAFGSAILDF